MKLLFGLLGAVFFIACSSKMVERGPDCTGLKKVPEKGCMHEGLEAQDGKSIHKDSP